MTGPVTDERHPVDVLLDTLRQGETTLASLSEQTGYHPGSCLKLIVRARAGGAHITASNRDGITYFRLTPDSTEGEEGTDE